MALNRNKELKLYYSISEVASMMNVTETLLRYWEKEFPNIKQVKKVYHLVKERGMTLQGARDMLKRNKGGEIDRNVDVIERLKDIRAELQDISRHLSTLV